MQKSTKTLFLVFVILICVLCVYKFYPFGSIEYEGSDKIDMLVVPKYSNDIEVTDNKIIISSLRSSFILQKEMRDILDGYEKYVCATGDIYYIEKSNLTIEKMTSSSWGILNKITLDYKKGRRIPDGCSRMVNK